jgi:hypothetical protein
MRARSRGDNRRKSRSWSTGAAEATVVAKRAAAATKEKKEAFMTREVSKSEKENEQLICPSKGKRSAKSLEVDLPSFI